MNEPTRPLPARANLEHLRNEAKQLLKTWNGRPEATLALAQLGVARRYGFASWRKLKAHVDALPDEGARLIDAVRGGDLATTRAVLDSCPELVNAATDLESHRLRPSDALTMRLIHLMVAENQVEAARLLIARGGELNVRNADGRLPLHDCFELGRDDLAQVLLAAGAEPDICAAAAYGLKDRLRELLARDRSLANDSQTGISPLGWCVYGNQAECAELLIESGARANDAWEPASHVANTRMASLFLRRGADPNHRGATGDTPLHAAIKSRLVLDPAAFVEVLLAAGADSAIRNNDGRTAAEEARLQVDKAAETYFPARPRGAKRLERTLELLEIFNGRL